MQEEPSDKLKRLETVFVRLKSFHCSQVKCLWWWFSSTRKLFERSEAQNLFKSAVFAVRQTHVLSYFPLAASSKCSSLLLQFYIIDDWNQAGSEDTLVLCSLVRSPFSALTTDKEILIYHENIWLNCHPLSLKSHIIPLTTDLHLKPLLLQQIKRRLWCSAPAIPVWKHLLKQYGAW